MSSRIDKDPWPRVKTGAVVSAANKFAGTEIQGKVVARIPAGEVPNMEQMHGLFWPLRVGSELKRIGTPTKASKYDRVVLQRRPGRCFAVPLNDQHVFYITEEAPHELV